LLPAACDDDTTPAADAAPQDAMSSDTSGDTTPLPDKGQAQDGKPQADAPSPDQGEPTDLGLTFGDGGCLTFDGASHVCGFKSDGAVCKLAVSCQLSSSESQCKINCEMGSTSGNCYQAADVACLRAAVNAGSCDDLKACNWGL
jgi:hypothetical protein